MHRYLFLTVCFLHRPPPLLTDPGGGSPSRRPTDPSQPKPPMTLAVGHGGEGPSLDLSGGMAALVGLNALVFAAAAFAKLPWVAGMALYNGSGAWWQVGAGIYLQARMGWGVGQLPLNGGVVTAAGRGCGNGGGAG